MRRKESAVVRAPSLAREWHPQFVSDVAARARATGLEYLGDMQLNLIAPAMFPGTFDAEASKLYGDDYVAIEQARDYKAARGFRTTLLVSARSASSNV